MRQHERSYIYKLNMTNGDQYSFIGVDACVEPGPKRPFNFFGNLQPVKMHLKFKFGHLKI